MINRIEPQNADLSSAAQSWSAGELLKACRIRIRRESRSLGNYVRRAVRVGKTVTQEEVAEAAGISRVWYAMMEGNRSVRVSSLVLGRLADVLAMETAERAALFGLVLPEVGCVSSSERSLGALEAFRALRPFTRRLSDATTERDALTLIRELCMAQFRPDIVTSNICRGRGIWNELSAVGDADVVRRLEAFHAFVIANFSPEFIDELNYADALREAGDVLTRSKQTPQNPDLVIQVDRARDATGWHDVDFMVARVRSRHGFIANVTIFHNGRHTYTEADQAQLGTIAEIASLALSSTITARGCTALRSEDHKGFRPRSISSERGC